MPSSKTTLTNCYTPIPLSSSKKTILKDFCRRPDGSELIHSYLYNTSNSNNDPSASTSASDIASDSASNRTNKTKTRSTNSIRHLCLDRSILSSSTGSSLIELGHTKVLCSVHGPRPITSSSLTSGGGGSTDFHSSGVLNCQLRYAPMFGIHPGNKVAMSATNLDGYSSTSTTTGGGGNLSSQEVELSSRLHDAISSSIPLDLLMKSVVDVFVMVLQDDGSAFAASVMAATLALSDAGVEIYDLVSACSVAVVNIPRRGLKDRGGGDINEGDVKNNGHDTSSPYSEYLLLVDPAEDEILQAEGIVTLAMMSNWNDSVTFWDQTGRLPPTIASEAAELCKEGCMVMSKFMRQCLIGSSFSSS